MSKHRPRPAVPKYTPCHASVPIQGIGMRLALFEDGTPKKKKAETDARLKSAAPKLLEALVNAQAQINGIVSGFGGEGGKA